MGNQINEISSQVKIHALSFMFGPNKRDVTECFEENGPTEV